MHSTRVDEQSWIQMSLLVHDIEILKAFHLIDVQPRARLIYRQTYSCTIVISPKLAGSHNYPSDNLSECTTNAPIGKWI